MINRLVYVSWLSAMGACGVPPTEDQDTSSTSAISTFTTQSDALATFAGTGDKPYLSIPEIGGNGHALTWDGRIAVITNSLAPTISITATSVDSIAIGKLSLTTSSPALIVGTLELAMQGDCNAVLYDTTKTPYTPVWSSGTAGKCQKGELDFQGDGNLVVYDDDGPSKVGLWSSGSSGWGAALDLYESAPWIGIADAQGATHWDSTAAPVGGWLARAFRPEYLGEHPATALSEIEMNVSASFSQPYPWGLPDGTPPENFLGSQVLTGLPGLNALAITRTPGYSENPFHSDCAGNALVTGPCMTYQMTIVTQYYPTDTSPPYLVTFPVTAIMQQPDTVSATVLSMHATELPTKLVDTTGMQIDAIEPTVTFDGQLIIYQRFGNGITNSGTLYYSFNSTPAAATGWSVPSPITKMNADPALAAKRYPVARYPIRDAYGALNTTVVPGAYAWLSPEGADLFFSATIATDGARRAGTSMIGGSTKGMERQVDGAPNVNRIGESPMTRLFVSSLGLTPGMWSPLENQPAAVLPLTDKRNTYPMFSSNSGAYFEVSAEETLAGNYDAYLDMAEVITQTGTYDTVTTQDLSGNFHAGTLSNGAQFPEEAYPATCKPTKCSMLDPRASGTNLFSGKAIYFRDTGLVTVPAMSTTGHQLLDGASNLTVSVAVLPLQALGGPNTNEFRNLVQKNNTFGLILEQNRKISGTVFVNRGGTLQTFRSTFAGTGLPLGVWSHVTMTYAPATGTMSIYVNGALVQSQVFAAGTLNVDTSPMLIGPGPTGDTSGEIYALDQVGVSRVVRTPSEITRQATLIAPRQIALPNALPQGLQPKDIHSSILSSRALDPNLIALGNLLFFDPLLSKDTGVSCVTCHTPNRGFTENAVLHPSLLIEMGEEPHTPRNTPGLFYLGLNDEFFFDGRAATLEDQATTVLSNGAEMGPSIASIVPRVAADAQYRAAFALAFPGFTNPITATNLTAALQERELSFTTQAGAGGSPYDLYVAGNLNALSTQQRLGMALFFGKARCAQCHAGSGLTDAGFHTLPFLLPHNEDGIADAGRGAITGGSDDLYKFATPSLRNVARTAPYFHDGSSQTLADVVSRYNSVGVVAPVNAGAPEEMLLPLGLTTAEQAELVAFLGALSSPLPTLQAPVYNVKRVPAPSTVTFTSSSTPTISPTTIQLAGVNINLQTDGNLVVYDDSNAPVWASNTSANCTAGACTLTMTSDGNVELKHGTTVLWSTGTGTANGPFPGASFVMSASEPYLRVLDAEGSIVWSSSKRFVGLTLGVNQFVRIGTAASGSYLLMQADQNLVLYSNASFVPANGLWSTNTASTACTICSASFQASDGNLVLYNGTSPYWASNTSNVNSKQWLVLQQSAPYLRIESETGVVNWSAP